MDIRRINWLLKDLFKAKIAIDSKTLTLFLLKIKMIYPHNFNKLKEYMDLYGESLTPGMLLAIIEEYSNSNEWANIVIILKMVSESKLPFKFADLDLSATMLKSIVEYILDKGKIIENKKEAEFLQKLNKGLEVKKQDSNADSEYENINSMIDDDYLIY